MKQEIMLEINISMMKNNIMIMKKNNKYKKEF